jgi:hypothetical protein
MMSVIREDMTLGGPPRSDRGNCGNWGKPSSSAAVGERARGVPSAEAMVKSSLEACWGWSHLTADEERRPGLGGVNQFIATT